jgi:ABC-type transport system substrate-binding protein
VLSRLMILPERAITTDVERVMDRAASLGQRAVALAERIAAATNADECLGEEPPATCDIASYTAELEELIRGAGSRTPPTELYRDPQGGGLDAFSYAAALLELVQALARAVPADGIDRVAAALPLVRHAREPVGSGPFSLVGYTPGERIELEAHTGHVPQAPSLAGVRVLILPDPAAAATALRAGMVDWLPSVSPEQVAELEQESGLRVAGHAEPAERIIVFNVRAGRVYDRRETRQAFALCIDKQAAVEEATNGRAVIAWGSTAPWSWARPPVATDEGRDVDRARELLSGAGWSPGSDGIMERDGERLTSEIHVRPSRGDVLAFLERVSRELRECGIELLVRELDLTGDVLLSQLRWPNEFETVLLTRELGVDPDTDLSVYESSRVTSADNPGDANAGGWASTEADRLLAEARAAVALEERATLYAGLEQLLATELPAYPLWYETGYSAMSDRVVGADGEIDLTTPFHDADLARWDVKVP